MSEVSTTPQPSTARIALKWGLITGLASIVFSLLLFLTEQSQNTALSMLGLIITVGGLVMAMREFKEANGGYMSYGQGLGLGTLTAVIAGMLATIFAVVYMGYVDPGIMERQMELTREKMEAQGTMSDEQIDQAMEMSKKFQTPGMIFLFGILFQAFFGFLLSLIVSAFLKNNRPVFE